MQYIGDNWFGFPTYNILVENLKYIPNLQEINLGIYSFIYCRI